MVTVVAIQLNTGNISALTTLLPNLGSSNLQANQTLVLVMVS